MSDLLTQLRGYGEQLEAQMAVLEPEDMRLVRVGTGAVRAVMDREPPPRRRWVIAAAGLAAVVAIVLAVLLWPRSGDPAPFIDQGTTIPDTTAVTVPVTTTTVTGTTMAASEALWDAPLSIPYAIPPDRKLLALSADDAWVLSEGGLFHLHDGATFRLPLPEPGRQLGRQLAVTPDGTLWMTTGAGVFSFDGEAWTRRFVGETWALTVDGEGAVWVGGIYLDPISAWLARWDGRAFVRIGRDPEADRQGGYAVMAATPDGSIWMAETGYLWSNLYRYAGGTPEAVQIGDYHTNPPSPLGPVGVFEIEVAPDGDLWVGGFVGDAWDEVVLTRYDGAEWTTYDWPFPDHSEEGQVLFFDLSVGPDGTLWVAFPGGLGSYDGANWSVRAATDTTGAVAGAVDVAPDGTVWYTDGDGLHTLTP